MDAVTAVFERAAGKVTRVEFDAKMAAARADFDGLLDEETLALLVLDELGLNEMAFVRLADLPGRTEASVRVWVERVDAPREFAREGRPPGRVGNCVVRDASGEARLTLWDRDAEKLEDGTITPGARLTVANARVKESRYGVELHASPWTAIEVEGALPAAKRKLLADVQLNADPLELGPKPDESGVERALRPRPIDAPGPLRGTLVAFTPTRPFRRADGGVGFVCEVEIDATDGRIQVVVWDEAVKALRAFAPGADIVLDNLVARPKGNGVEWHTTKETRVKAIVPSSD